MRIKQKRGQSDKVNVILKMRSQKKSIIEIAEVFNLSKQRIFAILKRYGDPLDIDHPIDKGSGKEENRSRGDNSKKVDKNNKVKAK